MKNPLFPLLSLLVLCSGQASAYLQPGRYLISSERRFEEANKHVYRAYFLTVKADGTPLLEIPAAEPYFQPTAVVEDVQMLKGDAEGAFILIAKFNEDVDKDKAVKHVLTLSFDDGYGAGAEARLGGGAIQLNVVVTKLPEAK